MSRTLAVTLPFVCICYLAAMPSAGSETLWEGHTYNLCGLSGVSMPALELLQFPDRMAPAVDVFAAGDLVFIPHNGKEELSRIGLDCSSSQGECAQVDVTEPYFLATRIDQFAVDLRPDGHPHPIGYIVPGFLCDGASTRKE